MTANVSFYVIAILALYVKSHSLQERDVQGNVLILDQVQKNVYIQIYTTTVRKALNAILGKSET